MSFLNRTSTLSAWPLRMLLALSMIAPVTALSQEPPPGRPIPRPVLPGMPPGAPGGPGGPGGVPSPSPGGPGGGPSGGAGGEDSGPGGSNGGSGSEGGGGSAGGGSSAGEGGSDVPQPEPIGQRPKSPQGAQKVTLNVQNWSLKDLVKYFAELTGKNFIMSESQGLSETVTIISHKPVSVSEAYEAFLQALELHGYTLVTIGSNTRVVRTDTASQTPIVIGQGTDVAGGTVFVTQIVPLENVSVTDLQSVVTSLASPQAKIVTYAPSNTFIITENAPNLKRILKIIMQLDVAAPKSRLEIIPVQFAKASEIQQIIEQIYGTAASGSGDKGAAATDRPRRRPRRDEEGAAPAPSTSSEPVSAGSESKDISKVMSDERTNSLIVLANEQGMTAIRDLVARIDVDVDVNRGSQIHVVYLEHAKAEEVATVLSNLSQGGGGSSSSSGSGTRRARAAAAGTDAATGSSSTRETSSSSASGEASNVTAVFDSGMRITHDENTNSLVIIASNDDFRVVQQVISKLDVRRRQVLIDAVILELANNEGTSVGISAHGPFKPGADATGIISGQIGPSSLGLTQDLLSGLAMGIFGPALTTSVTDPTTGASQDISIPAFGVVLKAMQSDSSVDIVSNPQLMTMDNEEATIKVGRKIPFPGPQTLSQTGISTQSYQREDVATELKVTPRVNSGNYVTLEVNVQVQEVEKGATDGVDPKVAGPTTSTREVETTVLVGDNQTVVLGGLVGTTETRSESKIPVLGDIPLIGALFRSKTVDYRKSNLMIFLTPHIIDDDTDMMEIMRVKELQRQEFIRRFYGKSRVEQQEEMEGLLQYSMNLYGKPTVYRTQETIVIPADDLQDEAEAALREVLEEEKAAPTLEPAPEPAPEDTVPVEEEP